jgi:hypothetical protein
MKTLKAICPAVLLALVLSVSVSAGDVQLPGAPFTPPPPPPPPATSPASDECVSTAVCSSSDDLYTSACAEILWALTSIF